MKFVYVHQQERGTYGALYSARKYIKNNNFLVLYDDELIVNDKKSRNLYADLLLGTESGEHIFCGPKMEYESYVSNLNNNSTMTFSNSAGMPVNETLFVPLAMLYIISDIFEVIMEHKTDGENPGEYAATEGKLCDNELEIVNFIKNYVYPILAKSNNIRFRAFRLYTLKNEKGLISELAKGKESLKDWSKRSVNANNRGITLSPEVVMEP